MADSEFWHKMEAEFHALPDRFGALHTKYEHSYTTGFLTWRVCLPSSHGAVYGASRSCWRPTRRRTR